MRYFAVDNRLHAAMLVTNKGIKRYSKNQQHRSDDQSDHDGEPTPGRDNLNWL